MQKIATALFLLSLMVGCNSTINDLPNNCIAVKYVRGICGNAVLKIQDSRYFDVGEEADGDSHVFLATLECFADVEAVKDKVFYVELNPSNFDSNCAVCLAMVAYSGSKHYNVRVHQVCGNNQE
jgi:hypothetical protein